MRIGPFHIECVIEFRVMEGSRIKLHAHDLDEAIEWADAEWEAEREREELAQYGDGSRAQPERRGIFARSA
jgi:hypothetical protein